MNPSTTAFIQCLQGVISFSKTTRGNRHRTTWKRLIGYIASSGSPSAFDKAAAFAEGYAQVLVDSEQIAISTDRDVRIIATVDDEMNSSFE